MAKGRMLNKRISKSDKLASLSKDRYRVIYFMLYPHLDCEGRYSADPRDIREDCCPRLRYTDRDIAEALQALHDVGLITIYEVEERAYLEVSRFDDFQVGLNKDREAKSEIPANHGLNPATAGLNPKRSEKVPLNLKVKAKAKVNTNVGLRSDVILYLNEKAGKNFSPENKTTAQLIDARAAEGRTLDDFKRVIDIKAAKWRGDPKMDDFLRPETLFDLTKMEAYLNEAPPKPPGDTRVGAHAPRTPEEVERDKARKRAVEGERQRLAAEYEPKIEAAMGAGKVDEAKRLNSEMTGQVERFASTWGRAEA